MKENDWMDIQESCPKAFESCKEYFMSRYFYAWRNKMLDLGKILEFLRTKGIGVQITGINGNWYCKLWRNEKLVDAVKRKEAEEQATNRTIKKAFEMLEER